MVSTEFGLKAIKDIKIGEKVWAYNEGTGEKSLQPVIHLIQGHGEKEIVDIELQTGEVLQATGNHPFYAYSDNQWQWLDANALSTQVDLFRQNGDTIDIASVESVWTTESVFNLTVANDHTYFVGELRALAHNAGICRPVTSIDMEHILRGTKNGWWHHRPGGVNTSNGYAIVKILKQSRGPNAPYKLRVRTPSGKQKASSFWPNSWSSAKIRAVIESSVLRAKLGAGNHRGINTDYGFKISVNLRADGSGGLKVLTAFPDI